MFLLVCLVLLLVMAVLWLGISCSSSISHDQIRWFVVFFFRQVTEKIMGRPVLFKASRKSANCAKSSVLSFGPEEL